MKLLNTRRSLASLRLTIGHQIRFLGMWLVMALVMAGMLVTGASYVSPQVWESYLALHAPMAREAFAAASPIGFYVLGASILLLSAILALVVTTGHRIAGPFLALQRTFEQIRRGKLEARVTFRDYDELEDLAQSFNGMMDELQAEIRGEARKTSKTIPFRAIGQD